ncbi:Transglutaminase-like superfamily protein [compost metagenome]
MFAIKKATELTENAIGDKEKVEIIYKYIINNIIYDWNKNVGVDYLPIIDKTIESKQGICYDFASLFASMLRSLNIPTKLVTGNSTYVTKYHAWNEVYLDNKWVIIDTTVDNGLKKSNKKFNMIKKSSDYVKKYEY